MKFDKYYKCLKNFQNLSTDDILVAPIRFEDRSLIRKWRNEQTFHLRQQGIISEDEQDRYFKHIVFPLFREEQPSQLLFSIYRNESLVGYGGLVHINWLDKYAELSFLTKTEIFEFDSSEYARIFSIFISTMKNVLFDHLHFNRMFTETYSLRPLHIDILESNGFIFEGSQRRKIIINGEYHDSLFHSILVTDER
jgi:hypothetical protein